MFVLRSKYRHKKKNLGKWDSWPFGFDESQTSKNVDWLQLFFHKINSYRTKQKYFINKLSVQNLQVQNVRLIPLTWKYTLFLFFNWNKYISLVFPNKLWSLYLSTYVSLYFISKHDLGIYVIWKIGTPAQILLRNTRHGDFIYKTSLHFT